MPSEDESSFEAEPEESMVKKDFDAAMLFLDKDDFEPTIVKLLDHPAQLKANLHVLLIRGLVAGAPPGALRSVQKVVGQAAVLRQLMVDDTEAVLAAHPDALTAVRASAELMHVHLMRVGPVGCAFVACLTALRVVHLEVAADFLQPGLLFSRSRPTLVDLTIHRTDELTAANAESMLNFVVRAIEFLVTLKYLSITFNNCDAKKPPIDGQAVLDGLLTLHPVSLELVEITVADKVSKWSRPDA